MSESDNTAAERENEAEENVGEGPSSKTRKLVRTASAAKVEDEIVPPGFGPMFDIKIGQVLVDRFFVTAVLGSGGMGVVYEAEDRRLGELVALKVIRGYDESSSLEKRLRREVQLARRVTHRNVCRIFDLFQHQAAPGRPPLDLVSMELLQGESLNERIRRRPMTVEEALPMLRQVARGLHAAHSLGIVHRDLKPGNIMLTKEPQGLRATITDFGLAQSIAADESLESALTQEGKFLGTPAYMAPEQVKGDATSIATDLYSLGILFFESLTGRLPFKGETPLQMVVARLTSKPEPLQTYLPDVDPVIAEVVDRCLKLDPEERWQSTGELLEFLDRGDSKWNLYGLKSEEHSSEPQSRQVPKHELTLADQPTDRPEASRRRIHRPAVAAAALSLVLAAAAFWITRPTPQPASIAETGVSAHSIEWNQAERVIHGLPILGDRESVPELGPEEAVERNRVIEAATAQLTVKNAAKARKILEPAVQKWPEDALINSKMAEILWFLGMHSAAHDAIVKAIRRADDLPSQDKLFIEALHYGVDGQWDRARETFRKLFQTQPTIGTGLWIVRANYYSGRQDPLEEIFGAMRRLPEGNQDLRIDFWEIYTIQSRGESARALELAQDAVRKTENGVHPFLYNSALLSLSNALGWAGRHAESAQIDTLQNRIVYEHGTAHDRAALLRRKGSQLWMKGYAEESILEYERAIELFEEIGSLQGQCITLAMLGPRVPLKNQIVVIEKGLETCRQGGFRSQEGKLLHHLARARRDLGQFSEALELFSRSTELHQELGNHRELAKGRVSLALLLKEMGHLRESLDQITAALSWFRQDYDMDSLITTLILAADLNLEAGRPEATAEQLDEAKQHKPNGRRLMQLYEASIRLAWYTGDLRSLESLVSRLEEHADNLQIQDYLESARAHKGLMFLLENKFDEALSYLSGLADTDYGPWLVELYISIGDLQRAAEALNSQTSRATRFRKIPSMWDARILGARIEPSAENLEILLQVESEARAGGFLQLALKAGLTRARLLQQPETLKTVKQSSLEQGLIHLADQAQQALDGF